MHEARPPEFAKRLLTWVLPREAHLEILGDLEEEFHERHAAGARSWYWRQALRFSIFFLAESLLDPLKRAIGTLIEPGHVSLRQIARSLARTPGFSLIVAGMMALGIGLNTAIFSFVYAILLRPFPYPEPDSLVRVASFNQQNGNTTQNSWPDLDDWRARNHTFSDLALFIPFQTDLRGSGPARSVRMAWITPELFSVLGIEPVVGRGLRAEEGRVGGDAHKAIISHHLWQTLFGATPDVVGRTLNLPVTVYTIVGVMPPGFRFPDTTDIWIPLASGRTFSPERNIDRWRASRGYPVIGRLRPGVTLARAQADLEQVGRQLEQEHPAINRGIRPVLSTLRDAEVGRMRAYLVLLLGSVSLVLLLCCVTVANLFLTRCTARVREMSIRVALGAGTGLLVRQLLMESLLLCACGGLAGVGVALVTIRAFLSLIPVALPFWMRIDLDPRALAYTALMSAATGIVFGLTPVWRALKADVSGSLRGGPGFSSSAGLERARAALVVVEVAFSVALVATAGLLIRSFVNLQRVESGFDARGVITAQITPFRPGSLADKQAGYSSLYRQVIRALEELPGVNAAAGADPIPYRGAGSGRRHVEVSVDAAGREQSASVFARLISVSPGYFHTMRIPFHGGRDFSDRDAPDAEPVVVLSARAADTLFASRHDAAGRAIRFENTSERPGWHRVVGVVGDVRYVSEDAADGAEVYFPISQRAFGSFDFVVRTDRDPAGLVPTVRDAIGRVDKDTAVVQSRTLASLMDDSLWQQRLSGFLLTTFAGVSLAVAALGLFEVMSYLVSLRTREIGIRLALGARPTAVLQLIASRGLALTVVGLALGLGLARLAAGWTSAVLFGVSAVDPSTLAGVALLFLAVAGLACAIPVWRAANIDPSVTLRHE
jgi:putative ABC transport system permease protein